MASRNATTNREKYQEYLKSCKSSGVSPKNYDILAEIAIYEHTGEFMDDDGTVTKETEWTEEMIDKLYEEK